MARVALLVQDDSAVACLAPLADRGCQVLGLCGHEDSKRCALFARRCMELGFGFAALQRDAVGATAAGFRPDFTIFLRTAGAAPLAELGEAAHMLRAGLPVPGAPWPEFAPIWSGHRASKVELLRLTKTGAEEVLASMAVSVAAADTALTLREKHALAGAALLGTLLDGGEFTKTESPDKPVEQVPSSISLKWDEDAVDRFIRAHSLPPLDAAQVVDPASGEAYFIESLEQYAKFREQVLGEHGPRGDTSQSSYAADTHWYSNVGGSIIKNGDSEIHAPVRVADKKRPALIPGAALGSRKKLRMNEPLIGPNADRYCSAALTSCWIGVEGPYVKRFERQLAQICGCKAACAVQSGTAALYGAMKALGVSDPSHHVLVPAFTCAACADAVVHAGGRPVPIDCDLDSYGVSLEAVRQALDTQKGIVGVVVAPCYGVPARDFYEIFQLCKERGIWLCEDACESYGARQHVPTSASPTGQVPVGSLATLCVISVRSEKMIGVGEGGGILGNDTTLVARAKWWCSRAPCRGVGLWRVYEHDAVGQNFRMPEMLAAVGSAAAEMLPVMIERKKAIHAWYERGFAARPALKDIRLQRGAPGDDPVWWITAALLPNGQSGEKVGMQLMKEYPDIEIRPGFYPLGNMAIFKSNRNGPCPNAEKLYHGLVCLPSSNQLTKDDIERVCDALAHAMQAAA